MSTILKGQTFYKTSEASTMAGISRSTLLRWIADGIVGDASRRDRRGWRLFSRVEVEIITTEAQRNVMSATD